MSLACARLVPKAVGTYKAPAHGWTCFHCGETFVTLGAARDHFGVDPMAQPGCLIKVQVGEERGLLMALRKLEAEVKRLLTENERLDHEAAYGRAIEVELTHRFGGVKTAYGAWLKYEAMEGRALAGEAIVREIETVNPEAVQAARDKVSEAKPADDSISPPGTP